MNRRRSGSDSSKKLIVLSIRLIVIGVLIALLVVAGLEFKTKSDVEKTATLWRNTVRDNGYDATSLESLQEIKLGNPVETDGKKEEGFDVKIYKWKRWVWFFEDYAIHVEYRKSTGKVNAVEPKW